MPHANIWIRKENEDRWAGITDKSAWVNAMLEKSPPNSKVIKEGLEGWPTTKEKPATKPEEAAVYVSPGSDSATVKNGANLCKVHGVPLTAYGKCLMKGCKYA